MFVELGLRCAVSSDTASQPITHTASRVSHSHCFTLLSGKTGLRSHFIPPTPLSSDVITELGNFIKILSFIEESHIWPDRDN